jgi:hypothetical protein
MTFAALALRAAVADALQAPAGIRVTESDLLARIIRCASCGHRTPTEPMQCLLCGCHLPIKLQWSTARCPAGKW